MKSIMCKVCCIALFVSFLYITKGYAESDIFGKESVHRDYVCNNQVAQNGNVGGKITMVLDEGYFSFELEELLNVYKMKDIKYARDFFTSKGFKEKTNNEDNKITITYDVKVIKIVVRTTEEVNPIPYTWNNYLDDEKFNSQFTKNGQFSKTEYRKIGFPIICDAIDFSVYPYIGYFYIGETVKK